MTNEVNEVTNEELKNMLVAVLAQMTDVHNAAKAAHNVALDTYGEFVNQRTDVNRMMKDLYGEKGQGGGVVDQVKELRGEVSTLRTFGISVPRWAWAGAGLLLLVVTVASVCVIGLAYLALRASVPGALP